MSAGTRKGVALAVAVVGLGAAALLDSSLASSDRDAQLGRSVDQARERAKALKENLRADLDRLLRTALSAASAPGVRKMEGSNFHAETFRDFFLTEDEWKPYRTAPVSSALFLDRALVVRTSSDGPTGAQLQRLVESAEVAGRAELAWAADALWGVSVVRLPGVARGDGPREVVIAVMRPVDLASLEGAWALSDGRMVLARHGSDAELMPLLAAVGHEKEGTHALAQGAAAAVDVMPGVWLWAASAQVAAPASAGRRLGLFGGAGVLALVALALGMRRAPEQARVATQAMAVSSPHQAGLDRTAMRLPAAQPTTDRYGQAEVQPSRYEVVAQLGEGGMARVFLAITRGAEGFTRAFVVKRLRPELLGVPESVTQFIDEARLGSNLVHGNIVPVFDFGRDADGYYLAQEYILGRDLDHLRKASLDHRRRPLEPELALYVVREALKALAYVHTRTDDGGRPAGLVHRDVSPNNLMISARGEVKLLDLGIAKAESNLTRTQAGMVKGNVFYMAPEQARGQPVDARADLFSLGLVLFTVVTGDTLYTGASNYELLNRAANGLGPPEWARVRALPQEVGALLERALQSDPAQRFESADAFAAAIPQAAVGSPQALQALMQSLFADELRREQERIQHAIGGSSA